MGLLVHPSEHKRMYLTGWQMRELRDEAGITCDFIELAKHESRWLCMEYALSKDKTEWIILK